MDKELWNFNEAAPTIRDLLIVAYFSKQEAAFLRVGSVPGNLSGALGLDRKEAERLKGDPTFIEAKAAAAAGIKEMLRAISPLDDDEINRHVSDIEAQAGEPLTVGRLLRQFGSSA